MTAADLTVPASGPCADAALECAHCGLPALARDVESGRAFCCHGCRTAWALLHECGLDRYYSLPERRGVPVEATGRSYAELEHESFRKLYVTRRDDGLCQADLQLEGVHCASCVWLIERVPRAIEGLASAQLNLPRALVRVVWDESRVGLAAIARRLDALGYRPHPFRGGRAESLRRAEDRAMIARIGVSGAIAANVMLAALALYSGWAGGMDRSFESFFRWVSLLLVTPALVWPGRGFFRSAWAALRTRTLHMDVPIALALGAGWTRGAVNTISGHGPIYFDGVAVLIFVLLVGRFLQQRAQRAAQDSAELLHALSPAVARVVEDGAVHDLPTEALLPGMVLEVRAGDTIAADGEIVEGESRIDKSLLSGESRPVAVAPGERVFAGTLNLTGVLRVRVEEAGELTRLGRILAQVESAAARRAPVARLADRLAGAFVAVVLALAALTVARWWTHDPSAAIDHAIALLVVTCPCALAMATPLAVTVAIGRAARAGILIKGGDALERLARPARMFLDKTGTVTEGRTALAAWRGPEWVKPLVLALERGSVHPIAAGFRSAWPDLETPEANDVRHTIGGGVEGEVGGRRVLVGSHAFVARRLAENARGIAQVGELGALDDSPDLEAPLMRDLTPVSVAVDGAVVARAGFGDRLRADAPAALARLTALGFEPRLLSGDDAGVVEAVGARLDLPAGACRGGVSPEEKLAVIEAAARERPTVMVGDGVNDAAAIARAGVGIAVRGGAEASLAAADVFLARPELATLVTLVEGSRRTMAVIRRNILFSLVYNLIGATLAVNGRMDPLIAAILMPFSSITVVLASWRSRTFEAPRQERVEANGASRFLEPPATLVRRKSGAPRTSVRPLRENSA